MWRFGAYIYLGATLASTCSGTSNLVMVAGLKGLVTYRAGLGAWWIASSPTSLRAVFCNGGTVSFQLEWLTAHLTDKGGLGIFHRLIVA